jgi:chromosome partitioning protein
VITAVLNRKGGVGKTTTAVSLGAAVAAQGYRVLLIDLDSQASTSLSLGVPRWALAPSSADVLLHSTPAVDVVRATRVMGLHLMTASTDLSSVDRELSPLPNREGRLQSALRPIKDRYDHILIDCPSVSSLAPLNAMVAADYYIVPVVPHYLAIEGVQNLCSSADRLLARLGVPTKLLGIVLTMVDYRTKTTRKNVARLREEFGSSVFAVEIRTNIRLAEAPAAGQTIFEFDDSSTGADAYRLLAEEFIMRSQEHEVLADGTKLATSPDDEAGEGASDGRSSESIDGRRDRHGTPVRTSRI